MFTFETYTLHMWFVMFVTLGAVVSFVRERVSLEVTSITVLTALLLFGQFFPVSDGDNTNLLSANDLLAGFANPSLIAVLALLVMGQAMIHTDALRTITGLFTSRSSRYAWISVVAILLFVMVSSGFVNNTPLVIIAIPIIQVMASAAGTSESRVMMPLSFAAILGGMVTLIGSSTNLLVSTSMTELGYEPLSFFAFAIPGAMMAGVGIIYVLGVLPRLMPDRASMVKELAGNNKEFVAELDINPDSALIGLECVEGKFVKLGNVDVKLIQRGGHLILPPFEGYEIQADDILIISASRKALTNILSKHPGFLLSDEEARSIENTRIEIGKDNAASSGSEPRILAEIMITPASRMQDMSLDHVGFHKQFGTIVLGIQRRARVVRRRLGRIRLEPGDVLLVAGRQSVINGLRDNPDFIVLSGSKRDLPAPRKASLASFIFLGTIVSAATGLITIPVAALTGAAAMIASGCLNMRQAMRAIDRKIFLLVGSMLALGTALQATGGAVYIADKMLSLPFVDTPLAIAAVLFIVVAISTNLLTNNACAILFTPIAMSIVESFDLAGAEKANMVLFFATTVIFAANCSFASPIGYQTNLLVMGPGHYRFKDFVKGGVPLVIILWIAYIFIAKFYFLS